MIGIIYIQDIKNCPFLSKYISTLDKMNIDYRVIYWNRKEKENQGVIRTGRYVEYRKFQELSLSKRKKIKGFLDYRKFLVQEIKNYDKLILLTTLTSFILIDKLLMNYKKKYTLDIRDPSFEKNSIFRYLLGKIIRFSYFTCISSEAFKKILPPHNYYMAHNFRYEDIIMAEKNIRELNINNRGVINLVYYGAVREYEHIQRQIQLFANNNFFKLYYYGDGDSYERIKDYVKQNDFQNIFIMGPYDNDDKDKIIQNADIINNHYPNNNNYPLCVSNKFYDSLIYKKPIISNTGGIDAENSEKNGNGIGLSLENKFDIERLYKWYKTLEQEQLSEVCNNLLVEVLKEDKVFLKAVGEFLKS